MARPRKAEDPVRWPEPCGRCGQHHQTVARWPDGGVCTYCYQQAKRTRGTCACGHEGVLPGIVDGQPACRRCSGVVLNIDCRRCGAQDELYDGGRCWTCMLSDTVDLLPTNPTTGIMADELVPMARALKSMKRANSGLTWIRQKHVTAFLQDLAVAPTITHEALDTLPKSQTRDFVGGLLVEHGTLPRRDLYRARYEEWARDALKRVTDPVNRDVIRRYIRWQHLRRMNQMESVSQGTFLRSKQTVTVAIEFVNWLTDHGIELAELEQEHLDAWVNDGNTTRLVSDRFLGWAIKTRLVIRELKIRRHRRGTSPRMSALDQDQAVQRVVHTPRTHTARSCGRHPRPRLRTADRGRCRTDLGRRQDQRRVGHRADGQDRHRTSRSARPALARTRRQPRQRPDGIADAPADLLATQLVHGDFRSSNVLCAGSKIAAVIDFEEARLGPCIDEVTRSAVMLRTRFRDWGPVSAEVRATFLSGYQSARQLTPDEERWWDVLVLWYALALVPPGDDPTGWGPSALSHLAELAPDR